MHARKKMTFRLGLALAASLLLWNLPQANAFSPNGGGTEMGGSATAQKVSGKVVETMDSGGYTYALVDKGGVKTWVALPQSAISVGSEIACQPGMEMNNFKSSSLNRSFDSIVFSPGLAAAEATVAAKGTSRRPTLFRLTAAGREWVGVAARRRKRYRARWSKP